MRLVSIADLSDADVTRILCRAAELAEGSPPRAAARHPAMLFLEPSLRTRTGFLAAAQRLGWPSPVEVLGRRESATSMPESLADTFAVLGAYFDVLVVRADRPLLDLLPLVPGEASVINGGDRGPQAEHPSQALIDAFATSQLVGPVESLHIVVCGDLRMRSARSLLALLARFRPAQLTLVTDACLVEGLELPDNLGPHQVVDSISQAGAVDAVHAVGIPHGAAPEAVRARLRVSPDSLVSLTARGRVFSPMPVIDEVAHACRGDVRMAFLRQSALGLWVRIALLELL